MTDVVDQEDWDLGETLTPAAAEESPPENFYPDVETFVAGYLVHIYAHPVTDMDNSWKWCPRWNCHAEAVARLDALWQAWEVLRLQPGTGPASWLRDYADPTMAALSNPMGTFSRCSRTEHQAPPSLPTFARTLTQSAVGAPA